MTDGSSMECSQSLSLAFSWPVRMYTIINVIIIFTISLLFWPVFGADIVIVYFVSRSYYLGLAD